MIGKIVVIGGGSWGATLADLLARNGHPVALWEFMTEAADALRVTRRLKVMPDLVLHPSVEVTNDLPSVLRGARAAVSAVPSEFVRKTWRAVQAAGGLPSGAWVVSVTKGLEKDTLKRMSEIIADECPSVSGRVAVLSGPSHAEEVARHLPTAVVLAGPEDVSAAAQPLFQCDSFRVYGRPDPVGVELGGALKNIYAIACGISDGLGLGDNTKAALMTRGLNEMTRVGLAMGAEAITFSGLSGLGDLIVTCTSKHSRNWTLGDKIGRGKNLKEALAEMTMVAEGVPTSRSARQLGEKLGIELPIINEIYLCLHEGKSAREALKNLMSRPVFDEMTRVVELMERRK